MAHPKEGNHTKHRTVIKEVVPDDIRESLRDTLQLTKESEARSRVLFTKIHNLQVEVQEMNKNFAKLLAALTLVLDHPESQTDAIATMKQFVFDVCKKKGTIG